MTKGTYVDGFVIPVPKKNTAKYKKMAQDAKEIWMKFGALDYKECMIDDVKPQHVALSFPQMAKTKPGEAVWFSFIVFKSKAHRNKVNARVMKDSLMNEDAWKDKPMPFDMKKLAYGGFKAIVEEVK